MSDSQLAERSVEDLARDYPGVDLAYDLAVGSYDSVIKRLDIIDGRLQTIMAFAATTTALVPTVAGARMITFHSTLLYLAIACFALQLFVGTYARLCGTVLMLNPANFYQKWLDWSPWEFKKNFIYWAGEDFRENVALVRKKWALSVTISILFFLEAALLVAWVVVHA
jgi:hypothetical protein